MAHHRDLPLTAVGEIERRVPGQVAVEAIRPIAFEVDGVNQEHHDVSSDGVRNDVLDAAVSVLLDPVVNGGGRVGTTEVERTDLRIEELPVYIKEILPNLKALAVPDRVGEQELD